MYDAELTSLFLLLDDILVEMYHRKPKKTITSMHTLRRLLQGGPGMISAFLAHLCFTVQIISVLRYSGHSVRASDPYCAVWDVLALASPTP